MMGCLIDFGEDGADGCHAAFAGEYLFIHRGLTGAARDGNGTSEGEFVVAHRGGRALPPKNVPVFFPSIQDGQGLLPGGNGTHSAVGRGRSHLLRR